MEKYTYSYKGKVEKFTYSHKVRWKSIHIQVLLSNFKLKVKKNYIFQLRNGQNDNVFQVLKKLLFGKKWSRRKKEF